MSTQLLRKYIDILNEVQSQAYPAPLSNQVNTDSNYQFSDPGPLNTKELMKRYGLRDTLFGSRPENHEDYAEFIKKLNGLSDDQLKEIGQIAVGLHTHYHTPLASPGPALYDAVVRQLRRRESLRRT